MRRHLGNLCPRKIFTCIVIVCNVSSLPEEYFRKTPEGCGCFRDLLESSWEHLGTYMFPNPDMPKICTGISGTRKRKPARDLGSTLPWTLSHFACGVFLKSTAMASSSFSENDSGFPRPQDPRVTILAAIYRSAEGLADKSV